MSRNAPQNRESGFALLFVFLLAAAVAISFYMQLPVAAFENQRTREQALLDRGEQYRRAIQLYFRKFKRYPAELKALEKTNNIRFIRRLYKDPLTGADEWRLIHISPAGLLTDSLVQKPGEKKEDEAKSQNTFITEGPSVGGTVESQTSVSAPWMRRRGGATGVPGLPAVGASGDVASTENASQPGAQGQPAEPEGESGDQPSEPQGQQQVQAPGGSAPIAPQAEQATGQPGTGSPQQQLPGQDPSQQAQGQQTGAPPFPFMPQPGSQEQTGGFQPGTPGQTPFQQRPGGMPVQQVTDLTARYGQAALQNLHRPQSSSPSSPGSGSPTPFIGGSPAPVSSGSGGPTPFIGGPPAPASSGSGGPPPFIGGPQTPAPSGSGEQPVFGGQPVGGPISADQPGQNPAASLIQRLLSTPNPRGLAGTRQQGPGGPSVGGQGTGSQGIGAPGVGGPGISGQGLAGQGLIGGQGIGGGIAGVATKFESDSIKIYNERQKYQEWEFVYDYRKDRMNIGLGGGRQGLTGQGNRQGTGLLGPGMGPGMQPGPLSPGPSRPSGPGPLQ
jgi:hypothetical protein